MNKLGLIMLSIVKCQHADLKMSHNYRTLITWTTSLDT